MRTPMQESTNAVKLREWGEFLGTRALGERVRIRVLETIRAVSGRVVLDFEGVDGMTQSFADEAFRKLLLEIASEEASRIVIRGASEDVLSVLRYATSKKEPAAG